MADMESRDKQVKICRRTNVSEERFETHFPEEEPRGSAVLNLCRITVVVCSPRPALDGVPFRW